MYEIRYTQFKPISLNYIDLVFKKLLFESQFLSWKVIQIES